MSNPFSTGPVHVWAIVPSRVLLSAAAGIVLFAQRSLAAVGPAQAAALLALSQTALYLGTGERGPRIRIRRKFHPVFNDIGGPELSFDDLYAGENGLSTITLTRWNEPVYDAISGLPFPGDSPLGDAPGHIGTMMQTEGAGFPMIFRFPNHDFKPALRAQGLKPAVRFYSSSLVDDDEWETGTAANKKHLIFAHRRVYIPRTNSWSLGDYLAGGIPALAPN